MSRENASAGAKQYACNHLSPHAGRGSETPRIIAHHLIRKPEGHPRIKSKDELFGMMR
jgi:hypothetical protein